MFDQVDLVNYSGGRRKSTKTSEKLHDANRESKERSVISFIKDFHKLEQRYSAYLFPHFNGDVALYQIFANIKDKIKAKKILGIFKVKSRMNVEELKEEISD